MDDSKLKILRFVFIIAISSHYAPLMAQNPIDLPFLDDEPANSFSGGAPGSTAPWAPSRQVGQPVSIRAVTGLDISTQLGLKLNSQGFGLHGVFLQRLLGILSAAQSLEFQRWQVEGERNEGEARGTLGFHLGPKEHYLFEPFLHLKAGYESWQTIDRADSNPVAGHDLGLMIKLTSNFWLTLARSDLYYGKDLERIQYRRKINDRHYTSTEAYFTLAF